MFPQEKGISGRKLVPQLAVGCILFTILGLFATYWVASAMTDYLKKHPFGKGQPVHSASNGR